MNRFSFVIAGLCALAVGCSDSSPTEPSNGTSTTTTFTIPLSTANEVPRITNADADASGTGTISLRVTSDAAGAIQSATADFQITVTGFPAGTSVTRAHVHNAAAGSNGGIVVDTTLAAGDLAISNGSGSVTKTGINVPPDRAAAILSDPAGHYFNVHTALNPDGAIRGQLSAGTTTTSGSGPGY
jgi:hypothetical protein